MNLKEVLRINAMYPTTQADVVRKHEALFKDELGTLKDTQIHIAVKSDAQPKFCKARPVPFALKSKVEAELDRLESTGVLEV